MPAPPDGAVYTSGYTSEGGQRRRYSPYGNHDVSAYLSPSPAHGRGGWGVRGGYGKSRPLPRPFADDLRALVGVVARLVPEKGIEYLLDCLPDLVAAVPDVRLLIVGDGPLRRVLETQARGSRLAERVVFTGSLDARPLLPSMSVLAVPSLTEGTPLAMLEAMAAGIPVVAAAVGGIPDHLQHGVEGLLVAPRDASALGSALIRLLRNSDEARRMGEAGRRRAAQSSHEAMVSRVERAYDAVVTGRRERAAEATVLTAP